ncbi:DinB family protein [Candidatus Amarolinea dominans]|uniref:DinB family protein n=1 Tax=Candidatus Amarolinea dominans TaxID=3140696 RepID=UPI003136453A|nr:DinB family protein [Anaerolineae bacterium]
MCWTKLRLTPRYTYRNPAWTVHDIVAHVTLSERGLQPPFNASWKGLSRLLISAWTWNERQVKKAANRSLAEMIAAMTGSRQGTLELLESLSDEQMAVEGMHPAGFRTTVAGVFKVMAYHERLHGAEIARALGLPAPRIPAWPGTDVSVTRE